MKYTGKSNVTSSFEEFEMVYTFLLLLSFQKVNISKNLGGLQPPPPSPPRFLRACDMTYDVWFLPLHYQGILKHYF